MTKGKVIAAAAHVIGVLFAFFLLWFVPPSIWEFFGKETAPLLRNVVVIALFAWGAYKLFQILQGRDKMSNKAADFLDNNKK